MDCISFFVWVGSGVLIVPLLAILKQLPGIGDVVQQWAWILAPLLAAVLPQIAAALSPYCGTIDPALWALIYCALTYLTSQVLYWIAKKFGVNV
jgi:hypothetical protein